MIEEMGSNAIARGMWGFKKDFKRRGNIELLFIVGSDPLGGIMKQVGEKTCAHTTLHAKIYSSFMP